MKDIVLMMKFGEKIHLEILQKEGIFYCNPIKKFIEIEDNKLRGDKTEAFHKLEYMKSPVFQVKEANNPDAKWLNINATQAQYIESYSDPLGNIFSMSAFDINASDSVSSLTIDNRFNEFGGHFLLIHDQSKFLSRIESELRKQSFKFRYDMVEYIDLKRYSGIKTVFQKDLVFSFQEEFRIYIETNMLTPFTFSIGSIEDISQIYDFEKVKTLQYKLK